MLNNKLSGVLISVSLIALLSACGQAKIQGTAEQTAKPQVQNVPESKQPAAPPVQDKVKQNTIKVYFGDESGEKLVEQEVAVSYKQEDEKYSVSLTALSTAPDSKRIALLKGITIKSAVLKNQLLTVDLSIAPEARMGAGGEDLLLQAMKKTLFQFSEIQSLEILVDGKVVDSLMGHMELPHPIKRD
ncbi:MULTISPECIES: GerMN domain-containing protein [unclassified Paenibacillus]|uniref:GerMN domain-containing protein n=1 Tax=unclassified Paenibacillus TaxID=185978 RepID=UPI0036439CDF